MIKHFMYVPFTGLGRYDGYRGNEWLKNRIEVFKKFTLASLLNQTNKNFILWVSWRPEEKNNKIVKEFKEFLDGFRDLQVVFTYHGVCFWDDKYSDEMAAHRLTRALIGSLPELHPYLDGEQWVYMTIQPSDDCYKTNFIERIHQLEPKSQVVGFKQGYIMNYATGELREYNPKTNPPFFTIMFPVEKFKSVEQHMYHTGPYKSHEYIVDFLPMLYLEDRGFLVGTHGENISTYFNHPYGGQNVDKETLKEFGLAGVEPIVLKPRKTWLVKKLVNNLPPKVRHKVLTNYIKLHDVFF